jgi:hypothetical protein
MITMKSNNIKKRIAAALLLTAVTVGGALISRSANAGADGRTSWGGFDVGIKGVSVRVPGGVLVHTIAGSGRSYATQVAKATTTQLQFVTDGLTSWNSVQATGNSEDPEDQNIIIVGLR